MTNKFFCFILVAITALSLSYADSSSPSFRCQKCHDTGLYLKVIDKDKWQECPVCRGSKGKIFTIKGKRIYLWGLLGPRETHDTFAPCGFCGGVGKQMFIEKIEESVYCDQCDLPAKIGKGLITMEILAKIESALLQEIAKQEKENDEISRALEALKAVFERASLAVSEGWWEKFVEQQAQLNGQNFLIGLLGVDSFAKLEKLNQILSSGRKLTGK